jgi:uncharacterized membrane protein YbaN (DUF454 family)
VVILRWSLGIVFSILGVAGVILPVLQGWVFFLLALLMFFPNHRKAAALVSKLDRKWPRTAAFFRRLGVGTKVTAGEPERNDIIAPR